MNRLRVMSLRSRLAVLSALVVGVSIVVAVVVSFVLVRHELLGQVDDQLRTQAAELQQQDLIGPTLPIIRLHAEFGRTGGYVQVVREDGATAPALNQPVSLPVSRADLAVAAGLRGHVIRDARVGGTPVRLMTVPLRSGLAVQIAIPTTDVTRELHRLALAFLLLGIAAIALAVGSSWYLARVALAPVQSLTETAERVAETKDLSARIDAGKGDEVGRLADSFNSMLDALERSTLAQQQLVGDASHELRTPLASLRTNAEVLRQFEALSPQQRRELVDGIVGQVDELSGLVADVVELARGEAPVEAPQEVPFDSVVNAAVVRARRHWPSTTFTVNADPVVVHGVAARLDRAVANLLDNAAKFSGGQGTVDVSLTSAGVLTVRDHGPGISEDALPHVFDRFYRADDARGLPGSGLGLAIVGQVIRSHGGTVGVHNASDGGAVAEARVPVATAAEVSRSSG